MSQCVSQYKLLSTHFSLLNFHCNNSLVWFEVSGSSNTINAAFSPGFLPVVLLLPCVMEILQLWISRTGPFILPNHLQMVEMLGWAISEPWIRAWVGTELVSAPALPYLHHQGELSALLQLGHPNQPSVGGRFSTPALMPSKPAHLRPHLQSQLHSAAWSRHMGHSPKCCSL